MSSNDLVFLVLLILCGDELIRACEKHLSRWVGTTVAVAALVVLAVWLIGAAVHTLVYLIGVFR